MKILIAADGSPSTERVLRIAENYQVFGSSSEYVVLYVVPEMPMRAQSMLDADTVRLLYEEEADQVFQPIREYLHTRDLKPDYLYKVGRPSREIAETAKAGNFDLIIMGTQGRGRLSDLVMGSVVRGLLDRCDTTVVVVH